MPTTPTARNQSPRQVVHLASDLETLRADCDGVGAMFAGVAILFGVSAALVLLGGVWTGEPLFTISFAFALTAAVAFGAGARALKQATQAAPRIVAEPRRIEAEQVWRRAA